MKGAFEKCALVIFTMYSTFTNMRPVASGHVSAMRTLGGKAVETTSTKTLFGFNVGLLTSETFVVAATKMLPSWLVAPAGPVSQILSVRAGNVELKDG